MNELTELLCLVGLISNVNTIKIPNKENNEEHNTNENYVLKGERILTLARVKKIREPLVSKLHLECIADFKYPPLDINHYKALKQISNAIIRTIKNHFKTIIDEESLIKSGIPFLLKHGDYLDQEIVTVVTKDYNGRLAEAVCGNHLILELSIKDSLFYLPCRPAKRFNDSSYFYKKYPNKRVNMLHLENAFYQMFLINWLNRLRLQAECSPDLYDSILYLTMDFAKYICVFNWVYDTSPLWLRHFLLQNNYKEHIDKNLITSDCIKEVLDYSNLKSDNIKCHLRIIQFFFDNEPFLNEEFLQNNNEDASFYIPYTIEEYGLSILKYMIMDLRDCQDENNHRKSLDGMVARAYTTKKNIPLHVEKAMVNSEFNTYFGFVEFDEDVDLSLIDSIIEEFKKINHLIFYDFKNRNIALRFRKLGRHHASGLYYPSIGAMVVDFRHPASFLHEYFHMLDDSLDNPSMKVYFSKIVERYQTSIIRNLNEKKKEGGSFPFKKGKYNLNYYLRRSEIFARCGEIYLFRINHLVSSLLKHEEEVNFAYPEDDELEKLIKEFYTPLLKNLANYETTLEGGKHEANLCVQSN